MRTHSLPLGGYDRGFLSYNDHLNCYKFLHEKYCILIARVVTLMGREGSIRRPRTHSRQLKLLFITKKV